MVLFRISPTFAGLCSLISRFLYREISSALMLNVLFLSARLLFAIFWIRVPCYVFLPLIAPSYLVNISNLWHWHLAHVQNRKGGLYIRHMLYEINRHLKILVNPIILSEIFFQPSCFEFLLFANLKLFRISEFEFRAFFISRVRFTPPFWLQITRYEFYGFTTACSLNTLPVR